MKKLLTFLLVTCLVNQHAFPQQSNLYLNGGLSLFLPWSHHSDVAVFPAFTVTPGLRLVQNKNFTLALNFPLSAGGTFRSDTFLGIDLPAMLSLHFGSAAANNDNSKLGFILGAGAAYMDVVNFYDNVNFEKVRTEFWGYRFNAGVSFKADRNQGGVPAIIFSFGRSVNGKDAYMVGIGLHFILSNK